MDILQAIVLGLIQGLTEFLPISSTAHLRVVPALLGWADPGAGFSAVIQLGTMVAVVAYFFSDLIQLIQAWFQNLLRRRPMKDPQVRQAWLIILGTIPIVIFGLLFKQEIKSILRSLWVVAGALIGLAIFLMTAEVVGKRTKGLAEMSWFSGILIGFAQAVALIPGSSRSGVTLTAGLFAGLKREDAARFSFLLSIPAIALSGLYELYEVLQEHSGDLHVLSLITGTLISAISGYLAIAVLMRFLRRHSTWVFVVYRLALGGGLIALLTMGILSPVYQ